MTQNLLTLPKFTSLTIALLITDKAVADVRPTPFVVSGYQLGFWFTRRGISIPGLLRHPGISFYQIPDCSAVGKLCKTRIPPLRGRAVVGLNCWVASLLLDMGLFFNLSSDVVSEPQDSMANAEAGLRRAALV